jgi:hypothetical protein
LPEGAAGLVGSPAGKRAWKRFCFYFEELADGVLGFGRKILRAALKSWQELQSFCRS